MKKKVDWLIVLSFDGILGGAEHLLRSLVEHFLEKDQYCVIFFLSNKRLGGWKDIDKYPNCTILHSPFKNHFLGYIYFIPFLISIKTKFKIKHTLSSQTLVNALIGFSKRLGILGKDTIIIARESTSVFQQLKGLKAMRYGFAYSMGYKMVDLIVFQTEVMKNNLINKIPWINTRKNIILKNPIDLNYVIKESQKDPADLIYKKFLIAAGRLHPVKGYDILIKSFHLIKNDFPDLELWIMGYGEEKENLELLADKLGISNSVKFIGFQENPFKFFAHAQGCVISSLVEGFPNVLLQMMAVNTRVVSTLCAGGIEEIEGVYTCEPGDIDQLADQIRKSLLTDNSSENRELFDSFLSTRTFSKYIQTLENVIEN